MINPPTILAAAVAATVLSIALSDVAYAQASRQPSAPQPAPPPTQLPPSVTGLWYDDTGDGAVEIAPCFDTARAVAQPGAQPDRLCGRIVWLKNPVDKAGRPLTDGNNPQAAQRQRPICGLQVLGGLQRMPSGAWDRGWVYDPKEGKSYDLEVRLTAPDRLRVTGYLGIKMLSETLTWTRAPLDLKRCL